MALHVKIFSEIKVKLAMIAPLQLIVDVPTKINRNVLPLVVNGLLVTAVGVNSMGFHFQKRVKVGKGVGINISKSGVSSSYRTKYGSVGSKGFSIRTGIPGLTFRSSWTKSKECFIILLLFGIIYLVGLVVHNIVCFLVFIVKSIYAKIID